MKMTFTRLSKCMEISIAFEDEDDLHTITGAFSLIFFN